MNPIYEAYCAAHKRTPDEMLAYDKEAWPGGCMCGFILWVNDRKKEFLKQHPEHNYFGIIASLEAWSRYLTARFPS